MIGGQGSSVNTAPDMKLIVRHYQLLVLVMTPSSGQCHEICALETKPCHEKILWPVCSGHWPQPARTGSLCLLSAALGTCAALWLVSRGQYSPLIGPLSGHQPHLTLREHLQFRRRGRRCWLGREFPNNNKKRSTNNNKYNSTDTTAQ